jgi:hypothetical protein
MTHSLPQRYAIVAQEQRDRKRFNNAGVYYTAAAHGWFMRFRCLPEDLPDSYNAPANSAKYLGRGVQDMLAAALCFRLENSLDQCQNRCKQGLLFIEDLLNHDGFAQEIDEKPRIGLLYEMIGDLRLFGEFEDYDDAYLTAKDHYGGVNSQRGWQSEPEFDSLIRTLVELAKSTDYGLDERTEKQILHKSLLDRIEYKRKHYPSIIQEVLTDGTWDSDAI